MSSTNAQESRAKAMSPAYVLDRCEAVPAIIGDHTSLLIVTGLAGTSRDISALTNDGAHIFTTGGVMGAAVSIGLGLALAQPEQRVLVATGDGELLMNIGALATVAVVNPPNLAILCVDNGHYGETGYQRSHTSLGVDLESMARGAGIVNTHTVATQADIENGSRALHESNGTSFVLMRVAPTPPPVFKREMDPTVCRTRFRKCLGQSSRG
jgi:thiamine pyrophosphate-dependent acetolactate synthase large subunit-like protein